MVVRGPYGSRAALVAQLAQLQKENDTLKKRVVAQAAQLNGITEPNASS